MKTSVTKDEAGVFFCMKHKIPSFVIVLTFLALTSCSVGLKGQLADNASLNLDIDLAVHPIFAEYLVEVRQALGENLTQVMDEAVLRSNLAKEKLLTVKSLELKKDSKQGAGEQLQLSLFIPSLPLLASKELFKTSFQYKTQGEDRTLKISIGPDLLKAALAYAQEGEQEMFDQLFGPDVRKTKETLESELVLVLSDFASEKEIRAMLSSARVDCSITLPAPIKSLTGFTKEGNRTVRASLLMSELLTARTARVFEVRY